ncbi:tRNA pseudouridine(55) synthase TruB [Candidatus Saccharibacteria bacterium]|nr:tRNA pseudouridine(55) synthase TruB [Candidatus Saccharibacteria bacterium]
MNLDSIILVDKPAGMTSFGVVARIRRQLTQQLKKEGEQTEQLASPVPRSMRGNMVSLHKRQRVKVGHTGTLDPFATGLMIILSGKMTKKSNEFLKLDKVYEATIHLGATSTTGDPEGEIVPYRHSKLVSESAPKILKQLQDDIVMPSLGDINAVLSNFIGDITQTPPVFSAIKINGQRAYKLARQGKKVDMPTRTVQIYSIELLDYNYPELKIRTHVSSGTYIRSLANDIGDKLGTGAYLTALRRTKIGQYDLKDAVKIDLA